MGDPIEVRGNTALKTEIAEIKRVQIAMLKAIAKIEEDYMEAGEYHGLSFE